MILKTKKHTGTVLLLLITGWWYWMPDVSESLIHRQNFSMTRTRDSMLWRRMRELSRDDVT